MCTSWVQRKRAVALFEYSPKIDLYQNPKVLDSHWQPGETRLPALREGTQKLLLRDVRRLSDGGTTESLLLFDLGDLVHAARVVGSGSGRLGHIGHRQAERVVGDSQHADGLGEGHRSLLALALTERLDLLRPVVRHRQRGLDAGGHALHLLLITVLDERQIERAGVRLRLRVVRELRKDVEGGAVDLQLTDLGEGRCGLLVRTERLGLRDPIVLQDQRHVEVVRHLSGRLCERQGDRAGVRQRLRDRDVVVRERERCGGHEKHCDESDGAAMSIHCISLVGRCCPVRQFVGVQRERATQFCYPNTVSPYSYAVVYNLSALLFLVFLPCRLLYAAEENPCGPIGRP